MPALQVYKVAPSACRDANDLLLPWVELQWHGVQIAESSKSIVSADEKISLFPSELDAVVTNMTNGEFEKHFVSDRCVSAAQKAVDPVSFLQSRSDLSVRSEDEPGILEFCLFFSQYVLFAVQQRSDFRLDDAREESENLILGAVVGNGGLDTFILRPAVNEVVEWRPESEIGGGA